MRLLQKTKNINREVRKVFTQGTQSFDFNAYLLCALCEKSLRLCGKNFYQELEKQQYEK